MDPGYSGAKLLLASSEGTAQYGVGIAPAQLREKLGGVVGGRQPRLGTLNRCPIIAAEARVWQTPTLHFGQPLSPAPTEVGGGGLGQEGSLALPELADWDSGAAGLCWEALRAKLLLCPAGRLYVWAILSTCVWGRVPHF